MQDVSALNAIGWNASWLVKEEEDSSTNNNNNNNNNNNS